MERRKFSRLDSNGKDPVQVYTIPERNRLHILDMALGGMRLRCDQGVEQIRLNEILLINILLNQQNSLEIACLIRHIKQNRMAHIDFGIEFLNLRNEDHRLLYSFIEMQRLTSPKADLSA